MGLNASGLSARLATTPGLVMTGAAHTKAQTITGSSGADTIIGSTKEIILTLVLVTILLPQEQVRILLLVGLVQTR